MPRRFSPPPLALTYDYYTLANQNGLGGLNMVLKALREGSHVRVDFARGMSATLTANYAQHPAMLDMTLECGTARRGTMPLAGVEVSITGQTFLLDAQGRSGLFHNQYLSQLLDAVANLAVVRMPQAGAPLQR